MIDSALIIKQTKNIYTMPKTNVLIIRNNSIHDIADINKK